MNYLITGGTGFIGTQLVKSLTDDGHQVTVLTRSERESTNRFLSFRQWNGKEMPLGIGLYDGVINLAGAGIAESRWTEERKQEILDSRILATQACVAYINKSNRKPRVFLSGSAVGIYGEDNRQAVTEKSELGSDWLAEVCKKWEAEAGKADCRTILSRTGVVLGTEGGVLIRMKTPYKLWLGGKLGDGQQGFNWIHLEDIVSAMRCVLEDESFEGPVNMTGPEIVTQEMFSEDFAEALNVMDLWTIPKFMLKLIFGEMSIVLWGGQKAIPQRLKDIGFDFQFGKASAALRDLFD